MLAEQLRKGVVDLGPAEREHEQRASLEIPERALDELHRQRIAPLQILEHEDHRMGRALGGQPIEERERDLLAHHPVIAARRRKRWALVLRKRNARELTDEFA